MTSIDRNLMTISANKLRESDPEIKILNGFIIRHVSDIEKQIIEEYKTSGKTSTVYSALETNFPVSVMPNKKAQYYVYSTIIDQLKINNYDVSLVLADPIKKISCLLKISWMKKNEELESQRQKMVVLQALTG